jgi:hypothetical protein
MRDLQYEKDHEAEEHEGGDYEHAVRPVGLFEHGNELFGRADDEIERVLCRGCGLESCGG